MSGDKGEPGSWGAKDLTLPMQEGQRASWSQRDLVSAVLKPWAVTTGSGFGELAVETLDMDWDWKGEPAFQQERHRVNVQ